MQSSPLLRWLGALAVMAVVVAITVPMLLNTITDTVVFGDDTAEAATEVPAAPSEIASAEVSSAGGSDDGGDGSDDGGAGSDDGGSSDDSGGGGSDDEFPKRYTVAAGDTGSKISEQFYGSSDGWAAIARANDIDPSAPLRVGAKLRIPAPE